MGGQHDTPSRAGPLPGSPGRWDGLPRNCKWGTAPIQRVAYRHDAGGLRMGRCPGQWSANTGLSDSWVVLPRKLVSGDEHPLAALEIHALCQLQVRVHRRAAGHGDHCRRAADQRPAPDGGDGAALGGPGARHGQVRRVPRARDVRDRPPVRAQPPRGQGRELPGLPQARRGPAVHGSPRLHARQDRSRRRTAPSATPPSTSSSRAAGTRARRGRR